MSQIDTATVDPGHGNSPAAWTTVIILLAAFVVGSVFFVLGQPVGVAAAAVLGVIALIVGWIMKRAGLGAGRAPQTSARG